MSTHNLGLITDSFVPPPFVKWRVIRCLSLLSCRGSADAIKHAQHFISLLIRDPNRDISHLLPKSTSSASHPSTHTYHLIAHDPPSLSTLDNFDEPVDAPPAKASTAAASVSIAVTTTSGMSVAAKATYRKAGSGGTVSTNVATSSGNKSTSTSTVIASGKGVKTVAVPSNKHQQTGPTLPDQKHTHPVTTTSTRSVTSSVSSTHTATKSSTPLTNTGAVRRLFTLTSQGLTQATVVVTATQTLSYPPKASSTSVHSGSNIKPIASTASNTPTTKPPIPPVGLATAGSGGGTKQPVSTINGAAPLSRVGETAKSSVVKSVCPPGSGTTLRYSSVLGSQECQPSVIEQPLQQIMKTPTILQEPATQLTKLKKKSTYSDAVGKKLPSSEMGSQPTANKMGGVANQHMLNLAPGTRPTMNDSGAMVKPALYFAIRNSV